jgi:hypothetical protein
MTGGEVQSGSTRPRTSELWASIERILITSDSSHRIAGLKRKWQHFGPALPWRRLRYNCKMGRPLPLCSRTSLGKHLRAQAIHVKPRFLFPCERSKHIGQTTTPHRTAPASATTSIWPTSRPAAVRDARDDPRGMLLRRSRWHPAHTWTPVYNLGSGTGASVRQMMDAFAQVTGIDFEPEIAPRRPGIRRGSSRPARPRPATSAGRCGTASPRMVESVCSARQSLVPRAAMSPQPAEIGPFVTPGASTPEHLEGLR